MSDWLVAASKTPGLPSGADIWNRYLRFEQDIPGILREIEAYTRGIDLRRFLGDGCNLAEIGTMRV